MSRRSTGAWNTSAGQPWGSATSPTTSPDPYSRPAASDHDYTLDCDEPDILAKLVYYAIMLFVLSTAFGVFGPNPISTYLTAIIGYLPLVFVAILIVIASAVAAGVKTLIEASLGGLSYGKVLANAASGLILAFGVIAALNQLHIATNVVNAVLYAFLAALVGVTVVAVGGGGIVPMRERWQNALQRYDAEKPAVAQQLAGAPSAGAQARQAAGQIQQSTPSAGGWTRA